jgi:hypothetical protein
VQVEQDMQRKEDVTIEGESSENLLCLDVNKYDLKKPLLEESNI